jgi:hypothetical protein
VRAGKESSATLQRAKPAERGRVIGWARMSYVVSCVPAIDWVQLVQHKEKEIKARRASATTQRK